MSGTAGQSESGADFRQKFEALQARNVALEQAAVSLAQKAFRHVQPGDFEGIDPTQYVERAEQVQATRESEREAIFTEMAAARGLDVTALSQGQPAPPTVQPDVASRIASLGELGGKPPAAPDNTQGLEGRALLEAIYAAEGTS